MRSSSAQATQRSEQDPELLTRTRALDALRERERAALAGGELHCIGATTTTEYRRYIEKDAALERRFQPVQVEEPSPDEARRFRVLWQDRVRRVLLEHATDPDIFVIRHVD